MALCRYGAPVVTRPRADAFQLPQSGWVSIGTAGVTSKLKVPVTVVCGYASKRRRQSTGIQCRRPLPNSALFSASMSLFMKSVSSPSWQRRPHCCISRDILSWTLFADSTVPPWRIWWQCRCQGAPGAGDRAPPSLNLGDDCAIGHLGLMLSHKVHHYLGDREGRVDALPEKKCVDDPHGPRLSGATREN